MEFVHADNMFAPTIYVYDGASDYRFYGGLNQDRNYGATANKKVSVMREFVNAESNHLGMALPKGRLRFYRRDTDGQLQFVGENQIDHTPREETIKVTTGNSFDLVGERKATNFRVSTGDKTMDETFEIRLRDARRRRWKSAWWSISTAGTIGRSRPIRTTSRKLTRKPSSSASRSSPTRSGP